jgi:SAM-dependent methyltransferase
MERFEPGARSSADLLVDRIAEAPPSGLWLDAGCGRQTFPDWRSVDEGRIRLAGGQLIGCDLDRTALRERRDGTPVSAADLERLPFADASFGRVVSNMVFEHIVRPEPVVAELVRVTIPGGRILIHTVNSRHYLALLARLTPFRFHQWIVSRVEGRRPEEVYPTQYRVNTETRLRSLFEAQGCRKTWGGLVADLPMCVPAPGLFGLALGWGLLERRLSRLHRLATLLRPNLLVEFERC